MDEADWEYWSIHVFKFAGASVAVGAGSVGVEVVCVGSMDWEESLLVLVDDSATSADLRPVSWDTRTPMATAARMTKTRARPHWDKCQRHGGYQNEKYDRTHSPH